VSEIAAELKIAPNYVYRLIADLKKDRKVKKQGKGLTAN
jgi:DNA-binding IscR family transcriptional regulator